MSNKYYEGKWREHWGIFDSDFIVEKVLQPDFNQNIPLNEVQLLVKDFQSLKQRFKNLAVFEFGYFDELADKIFNLSDADLLTWSKIEIDKSDEIRTHFDNIWNNVS